MCDKTNCEYECKHILTNLKYINPMDFCNVEGCLMWGDELEQCKICSFDIPIFYCPEHNEKHKEIKCYYCKIIDCVSKFNNNDWIILLNTINEKKIICSKCKN